MAIVHEAATLSIQFNHQETSRDGSKVLKCGSQTVGVLFSFGGVPIVRITVYLSLHLGPLFLQTTKPGGEQRHKV